MACLCLSSLHYGSKTKGPLEETWVSVAPVLKETLRTGPNTQRPQRITKSLFYPLWEISQAQVSFLFLTRPVFHAKMDAGLGIPGSGNMCVHITGLQRNEGGMEGSPDTNTDMFSVSHLHSFSSYEHKASCCPKTKYGQNFPSNLCSQKIYRLSLPVCT